MSRVAWITLSAAALVLLGAVATVAVLAGGDAKTTSVARPITTPSSPTRSFALPLTDDPSALALAEHRRDVLVGLAARPGGPVEIAALRAETPFATSALQIQIDGRKVAAQACGAGCSRIQTAVLDGASKRLTVRAGSSSFSFDLPARLPPSGAGLFARAQRTMDGLRSFRFSERLSSGRAGITTALEVQAPDRLRLRSANGFQSVIIGHTRWDYHDGSWERGPFPGLTVADLLMWNKATNVRVVGRRSNGVTELTAFALRPVSAWFRLAVEPTGRVAEAEMISPSHFMVHRYSDFNGRVAIKPPN